MSELGLSSSFSDGVVDDRIKRNLSSCFNLPGRHLVVAIALCLCLLVMAISQLHNNTRLSYIKLYATTLSNNKSLKLVSTHYLLTF